MNISKFDTVKPGWSIIYIEGSEVIHVISKIYCISFSEDRSAHTLMKWVPTILQSIRFGVSGLRRIKLEILFV